MALHNDHATGLPVATVINEDGQAQLSRLLRMWVASVLDDQAHDSVPLSPTDLLPRFSSQDRASEENGKDIIEQEEYEGVVGEPNLIRRGRGRCGHY